MSKVFLTPQAHQDLIEIWSFIAEDSEKAADDILTVFDKKIKILTVSPQIGRRRGELAPRLRSFPIGHYVVFYRLVKNQIEIIRVLHGSRDIDAMFES